MTPYYQDDFATIYHGRCEDVPAWVSADVLVTDPPYGMGYRSGRGGAFGESEIAGDGTTDDRDRALRLWYGDAYGRPHGARNGPQRPALVFGRWSVARPHGTRMVLTWEKGEHVGMGDLKLPWKPNTEEVYVLGEGFTGHRGGSVLRHLAIAGTVGQAGLGTRLHPTEKPLGLMRDLIAKCPPGIIADPFMGSGTTLRAAKDLGRHSIGIEQREDYCEVAARRMGQEVLDFGGVA